MNDAFLYSRNRSARVKEDIVEFKNSEFTQKKKHKKIIDNKTKLLTLVPLLAFNSLLDKLIRHTFLSSIYIFFDYFKIEFSFLSSQVIIKSICLRVMNKCDFAGIYLMSNRKTFSYHRLQYSIIMHSISYPDILPSLFNFYQNQHISFA